MAVCGGEVTLKPPGAMRLPACHASCALGSVLGSRHVCPWAAPPARFPGEDTAAQAATPFTVVLGRARGWTPVSVPPAARGPSSASPLPGAVAVAADLTVGVSRGLACWSPAVCGLFRCGLGGCGSLRCCSWREGCGASYRKPSWISAPGQSASSPPPSSVRVPPPSAAASLMGLRAPGTGCRSFSACS